MTSNLPAITASDIDTAKALAASDLLPGHLRGKPANIVLIAQIARSLHLDAVTALTQVAVVDGKPTLGASLQAALVRRAGHRLRVDVDDTALTATATLIRVDDPDTEHTARWDEAKATRAGLWGKGAWSKYPGAMLANRAITEVVRMAASDVLMGAVYDEDELAPPSVEVTVVTVDGDQVDTVTGEIIDVDDVEVIEP
jgi:hypothetical protein